MSLFKVTYTTSRTGKLVMGILALIAEFENDMRRERQMDGIKKAKERGVRFGRKPQLVPEKVKQIRKLRAAGSTVSLRCGGQLACMSLTIYSLVLEGFIANFLKALAGASCDGRDRLEGLVVELDALAGHRWLTPPTKRVS